MRISDEAYVSRYTQGMKDPKQSGIKELSKALKSDAKTSTRIQIVSGYYGEDYVIEILKQIPTKKARSSCVVTLIFGYDSSSELFHGEIRKTDLTNKIKKLGYKNINITLFKDRAPLHTKLYGFLKSTQHIWYIGSANLSSAIEGGRHELMVRVVGKSHSLEAYIQALLAHKSSEALSGNSVPIGITDFLSAGSILFRPSRHRKFTYDGFDLKPDDRHKISQQLGRDSKVPHSDPSAEGFGFDLLSAIGVSGVTHSERHRVTIRHYCIESVYGYWVPAAYTSEIESKIANGRRSEENILITIRDALAKTKDTEILKEFHAYLDASTLFFKEIGIRVNAKNDAISAFKKFLAMRRTWLQDDEWIKRNSSKYILTAMPNIWHDAYDTESFISSFCEDISSVLNSTERKPKIYQEFRKRLRLTDTPSTDEIRTALNALTNHFWS